MLHNPGYRPDIDGLRAVAVLAVIANHLPAKYLSSGFLGVDVFFVISGFVVTASVLKHSASHLGGFYAEFLSRRVRRLLPALIAFVAITCWLLWLVDPAPQASLLTGLASLLGAANFALIYYQLDYFSTSTLFNAFTHTWSLSVEEQFYLLYPLLFWLAYFRNPKRIILPLAVSLLVISSISLVLFLLLYDRLPTVTYFLMPMRFWELGLGALCFLLFRGNRALPLIGLASRIRPVILIGLVATFTSPLEYARWSTLAATLLTALLLLAPERKSGVFSLSSIPIVYIGKISYSLYLWHWPVVVIFPMALGADWQRTWVYLVIMFAAASASYHLVEKPLRLTPWTAKNYLDICLGLSVSLILAITIYAVRNVPNDSVPRFPADTLRVFPGGPPFDPTCVIRRGQKRWDLQNFDKCTVQPRADSGLPMLWAQGDSHVGHLHPMLYRVHVLQGLGFHLVETHGKPFPAASGNTPPPRELINAEIHRRMQPGDIMVIGRLFLQGRDGLVWIEDFSDWLDRISALALSLEKKGVFLVITGPPPRFLFDDKRECIGEKALHCQVERASLSALVQPVLSSLRQLELAHGNVIVFDLFNSLCPAQSTHCSPYSGDIFIYRDNNHLNVRGSAMLAEDFIQLLEQRNILPTAMLKQ